MLDDDSDRSAVCAFPGGKSQPQLRPEASTSTAGKLRVSLDHVAVGIGPVIAASSHSERP